MIRLFAFLTNSIGGKPIFAIGAAILWGILSMLLSPCHIASLPLIVGFIDGQGDISTKRAFGLSVLFAFGMLITIGLIGLITGLMGRLIGDIGAWGNRFVSVVFLIVGLNFLEFIPLPFANSAIQVNYKKKGLFAALILGLVFGIALGPCTFAFMAPMIGITFKIASADFLYGSSLLLMYGLGYCSVIVIAGTSIKFVNNYLSWNETSKGTLIVKKICGLLVIVGGVYLFWKTL